MYSRADTHVLYSELIFRIAQMAISSTQTQTVEICQITDTARARNREREGEIAVQRKGATDVNETLWALASFVRFPWGIFLCIFFLCVCEHVRLPAIAETRAKN